jgi:hypothetical protein
MRGCELPQLLDIGPRALEIVRLESRFRLRDQIGYFLRILRCVNNRGCRRMGRFAVRTEQFESEYHHSQHDGGSSADDQGQAPGVEFFRR